MSAPVKEEFEFEVRCDRAIDARCVEEATYPTARGKTVWFVESTVYPQEGLVGGLWAGRVVRIVEGGGAADVQRALEQAARRAGVKCEIDVKRTAGPDRLTERQRTIEVRRQQWLARNRS